MDDPGQGEHGNEYTQKRPTTPDGCRLKLLLIILRWDPAAPRNGLFVIVLKFVIHFIFPKLYFH